MVRSPSRGGARAMPDAARGGQQQLVLQYATSIGDTARATEESTPPGPSYTVRTSGERLALAQLR